jgi:hypothetical protein
MNIALDNPCKVCTIHQDCCTKISGLRLSRSEYTRHFESHRDLLDISERSNYIEVSGRGAACPNWIGGQCSVYETRPMECRLFPYTTGEIARFGRYALISYHARTHCPQKQSLLPSREETVRLLTSFAKDTFGPNVRVLLVRDTLLWHWARTIRQVPGRCIRAVGRLLGRR